jgi:glutaminyl-peptide cyclotransferase
MARILIPLIAIGLFVAALVFFKGGEDKPELFSGELAMAHVKAIVDIGPRTPGSAGIERARLYIEKELNALGWAVERQSFEASTVRGTLTFVNLRARLGDAEKLDWKKGTGMALLASHYDTKFCDDFVFVGANDGGSSTGALIEMARVIGLDESIRDRVELVFFDGEENIGGEYTATDGLFGSREYAKMWRGYPAQEKPRFGFLLDMVGDKDLKVKPPMSSPRDLLLELYRASEKLGYRKYFGLNEGEIIDDHVPLNQAGIPTLDVIDLDYGTWHQAGDTLDQLSAQSLEICGASVQLALRQLLVGS